MLTLQSMVSAQAVNLNHASMQDYKYYTMKMTNLVSKFNLVLCQS